MIGSVEFSKCLVPVAIHDVAVLAIEPPEELAGPFRLSAYICDVDGNHLFTILRNEWRTNSSAWDVEVVGPLITIRKTAGDVALRILANPPHGLTIEKLSMKFGGTRLFTLKDSVLTTAHDGRVGSFSGGSFGGSIGLHYRWIESYKVDGWGAGFGRPISLEPNEKGQMIISFLDSADKTRSRQ